MVTLTIFEQMVERDSAFNAVSDEIWVFGLKQRVYFIENERWMKRKDSFI